MNKEVIDALHMLLHCALKDKEYETQKEQFDIVYKHIEELQNKIDKAIKRIELLGKFDGEHCTRNFKMMSADFNYLLKILKESDVDECE